MSLKTEVPIIYWSEGDEKRYYTIFDDTSSAIDEFLSKDKEDIHNFSWTPQNASNVYVHCDEVISHRLVLAKVPFRHFSKMIINLENQGYVEQKNADTIGESNQLYVLIFLDRSEQPLVRTQIEVFTDIENAVFEYETINQHAFLRGFTPPAYEISYEESINDLNNNTPLYGPACKLAPVNYYRFSDYYKYLESNMYSIFSNEFI